MAKFKLLTYIYDLTRGLIIDISGRNFLILNLILFVGVFIKSTYYSFSFLKICLFLFLIQITVVMILSPESKAYKWLITFFNEVDAFLFLITPEDIGKLQFSVLIFGTLFGLLLKYSAESAVWASIGYIIIAGCWLLASIGDELRRMARKNVKEYFREVKEYTKEIKDLKK